MQTATEAKGVTTLRAQLDYFAHTNRVRSITGSASAAPVAYEYDAAGNPVSAGPWRYQYDAHGRLHRLYFEGKLRAEYVYNSAGERIRKDVYERGKRTTTFFLYEQHRLIAEANEHGRITREYIYLGRHPVVMLEDGRSYWIHTDHIGTPRALTDAEQRIVWHADYEPFGTARVNEDPDRDGRITRVDLRFPGQYLDRESGTHYNYYRDYDPRSGRYLTPDPSGAFGGVNAFSYVNANPIQGVDPLGLYDEMVHYYMTYFLGIVAGLPQDIAQTMALAAAYIDENPLTRPEELMGHLPTGSNERAVPLYHFVLDYGQGAYGDRTSDPLTRFYSPSSAQLDNLLASTDRSRLRDLWVQTHPSTVPGSCPVPNLDQINRARYQLYGEYLHAYEDTFAHRDSRNMAYAAQSNSANTPIADVGHFGVHGPSGWDAPDRTYNQDERPGSSQCEVIDPRRGPYIERGLTEQQCAQLGADPGTYGSRFTPPPDEPSRCEIRYSLGRTEIIPGLSRDECMAQQQSPGVARTTWTQANASEWRYNELRTLRMEYEVLEMLSSTFSEEIERHREERGGGVPQITWQQLAGRDWDNADAQANARLGLDQTYGEWLEYQGLTEAGTVLQRYNASSGNSTDRLEVLNQWLRINRFVDANGDPIRIPAWPATRNEGESEREQNIGWIPAGSLQGVLLPSDEGH
jgi:RHS repeat-associated protein